MNLLFICSRNRRRSLTAETVFSNIESLSILSAGTSSDAETVISADLVEWADLVFVMESHHREKLQRQFGALLRDKPVIVLGIRDRYEYMDEQLVQILRKRVIDHLRVRGADGLCTT